eukprot:3714721-Amphidinium_carterae.1
MLFLPLEASEGSLVTRVAPLVSPTVRVSLAVQTFNTPVINSGTTVSFSVPLVPLQPHMFEEHIGDVLAKFLWAGPCSSFAVSHRVFLFDRFLLRSGFL